MPRNRKSVESMLQEKGFVRIEGDHHYFIYVTRDGKKTRARTKTSHSPKVREIPDGPLGQMAKQCLLTKPEFMRLVDCPMDREKYERRLVELGEIDEPDEGAPKGPPTSNPSKNG